MMPSASILYFLMACLLLNFALELQAGVWPLTSGREMSFMARTSVAIIVVSCGYHEDKGTKVHCAANLTVPHYQVGFSVLFLSLLVFYLIITPESLTKLPMH